MGKKQAKKLANAASVRADFAAGALFSSLADPALIEMLRGGSESVTGKTVNVEAAMRNPAMFRAVMLISNSIGMLPLHLLDKETKQKATDHPLFKVLHRRPNGWQSAYDFRTLMQLRALTKGDAYARIIRSTSLRTGEAKILQLVPIDPDCVTPEIAADWTVTYRITGKGQGVEVLPARDVFHLRGPSFDGLNGISLVRQARDAIAIAMAAELAVGRMFRNGAMVGGALKHKGTLSNEAYGRLQESLAEKEGAENAGKNLILEEGMEWAAYGSTAKDSQAVELRALQIEEIARITGVPRPLLMVDETSWGSGIEALGQFFVAYALGPWFEAWQQAVERSLLSDSESERLEAKFNPGALLRGSLKDQAEYLSKALGAGGHQPWMHYDEARDVMDLPEREKPENPMMDHNGGPTLN